MKQTVSALTLFFLLPLLSAAQSDTIFQVYNATDTFPSRITEMTILENDKIAMLKQLAIGFQIVITDNAGQLLYDRAIDTLADFKINSAIFLIDGGSELIVTGNISRDTNYYFAVFRIDTLLQHISLIDTFKLEKDNATYLNVMKFNAYKQLWEGFAAVKKDNASLINKDCYIALDTNYKIAGFSTISGMEYPKHILEFEWISDVQRYLISTFGGPTILVNEQFEVVFSATLKIDGEYNHTLKSCFYEGDITTCLGYWPLPGPYQIAVSRLQILEDTIIFLATSDISDPAYNFNTGGATHMRKDADGNFIVSGVNQYGGNEPNTIGLAKFTPEIEPIWTASFQNGAIFFPWDAENDSQGHVVVGDGRNLLGTGSQNGFLLRINSNGSFTSSTQTPPSYPASINTVVFPNPAHRRLCVQTNVGSPVNRIQLVSLSGRSVLQTILHEGVRFEYCIDLQQNITSGAYLLELIFENGESVSRKVVVD